MTSRSIYSRDKRGFTLIEIIIVLALFSVLAGFGLVMSMSSYRGFTLRDERDTTVSVLELARARALANLNGEPWGVCFDQPASEYVMFRGTSYQSDSLANEPVPAGAAADISGFPLCSLGSGVIFAQLSATTTPAIITVTQNGRSETVSINYEGAIIW